MADVMFFKLMNTKMKNKNMDDLSYQKILLCCNAACMTHRMT